MFPFTFVEEMPAPFGTWAPATTMAEFKARCPRITDLKFPSMSSARAETYYNPEAMAHFKDPQQFKDAVDTTRRMMISERFFGEGVKMPRYGKAKLLSLLAIHSGLIYVSLTYYYTQWLPATNPSWRKVVNKEWEEAMNNSPWDHLTHVWGYSDRATINLGVGAGRGQKKFYIPA